VEVIAVGILEKLLGRDQPQETMDFETECPHTSLAQRWRNADEMGDRALATYVCAACGYEMTYEEARAILEPAQPVAR
jgi:hypothetical protein